jgi:hypothetical protein
MDKYTYKQLQEMLPEYIFNELTESEAKRFEEQIQAYPDLLKEVEDSKAVFGRIDKMKINDEFSSKSRNLSVKVNQRLKNDPLKNNFTLIAKLALPTAALAIIVAMVFLYDDPIFNKTGQNEIAESQTIDEMFELSTSEKLAVIESIEDSEENINVVFNDIASKSLANSSDIIIEENIDEKLDEMEDEIIENKVSQMQSNEVSDFIKVHSTFGDNILNDIENLTEEEFQILLEKIENEKFI